jgi:hypothetical protein
MKRIHYFLIILPLTMMLVSCSSDYYTIPDYARVKKIDAHIHYLTMDNALSLQAKDDNFYLLDVNFDEYGNDDSLRQMEKYSMNQKAQFPQRYNYLASFTLQHWNSPDWAGQTIRNLNASFTAGAVGVKIWKNIGMSYRDSLGKFIMIDNPRFDSLIGFILNQDKSILAHLGEPKNCWLPMEQITTSGDREYFSAHPQYYMFIHPDYPSYQVQLDARDRFVGKYPQLRIIGAHLGSLEWSVDELALCLDKYPWFAVDMSARLSHLQYQSTQDYDKVRNFVIKYQDQLLYGSDEGYTNEYTPGEFRTKIHEIWMEQWKYLVTDDVMTSPQISGSFKGLKLPKKVIDKIYWSNAIKWYKLKYTD